MLTHAFAFICVLSYWQFVVSDLDRTRAHSEVQNLNLQKETQH